MRELLFEKVGDVNCTYPYILVYFQDKSEPLRKPFMEIAITDARELKFTIFGQPYGQEFDVVLTVDQWRKILAKAEEHLPKALAEEDEAQSWERESE